MILTIWLIGTCLVLIDMLYALDNEPIAKIKYQELSQLEQFGILVQLFLLAFIGSWFIIIWRIVNQILITYLHKRRK